jgi:UDP-N-acetyl-D-glucosamine dehydrogenase
MSAYRNSRQVAIYSADMPHPRAEFFRHASWTAGVIGLGYVGLPVAVTAVERGLACVGFDVDEDVVAALAADRSHIDDVSSERLAAARQAGLQVTSDPTALRAADALFICVPSPLGRNREPDMSFIEAAAGTVTAVAREGQLVALESTSYPGTTEEVLLPKVLGTGLVLDRDVFVCFSPERVDPGNRRSVGDIPKVVGGVTATSGEIAAAAYGRLAPTVHLVSSARAAEMTKLLENTYRAVNIGLANEMAQLAHALDIDIWEVVDAAASKPFGFEAFYPGPGVGGHCIPLDPQYLAWRAREAKFATRFIDLAEQVNIAMPDWTVARIADLLNEAGLPVHGTPVLAVGITYKPNVADHRESPALEVLERLIRRGADVAVLDPLIDDERIKALGYPPATPDELDRFPLAVILADHDELDLAAIARNVDRVFDARGAYRRRGLTSGNVVSL